MNTWGACTNRDMPVGWPVVPEAVYPKSMYPRGNFCRNPEKDPPCLFLTSGGVVRNPCMPWLVASHSSPWQTHGILFVYVCFFLRMSVILNQGTPQRPHHSLTKSEYHFQLPSHSPVPRVSTSRHFWGETHSTVTPVHRFR